MIRVPLIASVLALSGGAQAETPEILQVETSRSGMGWTIDVTLEHGDTGWDHYADTWELTDAKGNILGRRELMHPHVHEQPFTRSLSHVMLPDGTREIYIRAHCSKGSWTTEAVRVSLQP